VERAEMDLDLNTSTLPLQEEAAFQLVHVIGEKIRYYNFLLGYLIK
jgi:hypothetical protein